jgi:cyclase
MKRHLLLALLLGVTIVSSSCEKRSLDKTGLVKLTEHVYAMIARGPTGVEGLGANSGFVVGRDGVLVIDTRYTPALANELLGAIRSVTSAPIKYVVNTHYHPDHAWGNMVFKEQGALIMACPETREALETYSPAYLEYYKARSKETFDMLRDIRIVAPDSTITDGEEIDLGDVKVELRYFGPAHTAGDCVVIVPQGRVAFVGGLLSNGYHPNMGDPGADYDNWIATLGRLDGMNIRCIVPGQGKVCGREALGMERKYIVTLREQCARDIRQMIPMERAAASIAIPGTEGYLQPNILPFNVQAIYRREIPTIVRRDFAFDLPAEFQIMDGGGSTKLGFIRWAAMSKTGTVEIEVQWKPTANREVIVQDITDIVRRYAESSSYEMSIKGSMRIEIGGEKAPASFGTWNYGEQTSLRGSGIWTWALIIRGGKMYSIRLFTDAGADERNEETNMDYLRRVASTFRVTPRAS